MLKNIKAQTIQAWKPLFFLFISVNAIFACYYLAGGTFLKQSFLFSAITGIIIFLAPGASWLSAFSVRIDDSIIFVFLALVASTFFFISALTVSVFIGSKFTASNLVLSTLIFTNTGLFLGFLRKGIVLRITKKAIFSALIIVFTSAALFHFAVSVIPALQDETITTQGTVYGLINYLKPYVLKDDGLIEYDFAHPLLLHFYEAGSVLLYGHLDYVKYYYDYAKLQQEIKREAPYPGQKLIFSITGGRKIEATIKAVENDFVYLDKDVPQLMPHIRRNPAEDSFHNEKDGDFVITDEKRPVRWIDYGLVRQAKSWNLLRDIYLRLFNNPHLDSARMPNLFFTVMAAALIYYLLFNFTGSIPMALFSAFFYLTMPDLLIRSLGGTYTAISNYAMLMVFYVYLKCGNSESYPRWMKLLAFLAGGFAAVSDHKTMIVPAAMVLSDFLGITGTPTRNLPWRQRVSIWILLGFLTGYLGYWLYGLSVDKNVFLFDHFHNHFLDRIIHRDVLEYAQYHLSIAKLWKSFCMSSGLPFIILSLFFILQQLNPDKQSKISVLATWVIIGALSFTLIDWRLTKHLLYIVPALVICTFYSVSILQKRAKIITICILAVTMAGNIVTLTLFFKTRNLYLISPFW